MATAVADRTTAGLKRPHDFKSPLAVGQIDRAGVLPCGQAGWATRSVDDQGPLPRHRLIGTDRNLDRADCRILQSVEVGNGHNQGGGAGEFGPPPLGQPVEAFVLEGPDHHAAGGAGAVFVLERAGQAQHGALGQDRGCHLGVELTQPGEHRGGRGRAAR